MYGEANTAHDAALAQYGATHPLTLRTQLALAERAAGAGEYENAETQLQPTVAGLRKLGPQGESNLAQALVVLGDAAMHLGQNKLADATLREAVTIREKSPDDLWELALARELLGETLAQAGSVAAPEILKKAAHDLESQLGADHPETLRAKATLARIHT